jgi:signal transduction histidine kinase
LSWQIVQANNPRDSNRYLRLSQFLDLQARWMGAAEPAELAHRIRQTVGLLVPSDEVELELVPNESAAARRAALTDPLGPARSARESGLVRRALTSLSPQLQSQGERAVGVFPFGSATGVRGYLRVVIPRPLFEGVEVSFLRFVASLSGVVLGAPDQVAAPFAGGGDTSAPERDARRYVAMAVHDLRNPLNVISGYGDLLADGTLGPLTSQQAEAVAAINRQLEALSGLINRLIDFDRLARAETTVSATQFNVRALFDEIREHCFGTSALPVAWPGAEAGFEFVTDRRRLFAVIQNLVDNAVKHAAGEAVTVFCSRRDGRLEISVTDRGPGLAPVVKTALTDREACERLRERGSGLGLYTVACYVRALGGRLEVKSPEDGGTEIAISLPPLQRQEAEPAS